MAVYKYSCRKCPIRNRCIREGRYTTSVKNMIRNAFEARTDTLATWGLLQANCLLIKAEEEQARKAQQESMLSRRLREAREARREAARAEKDTNSVIRRLPKARKVDQDGDKKTSQPPAQQPDYLQPVVSSGSGSLSNDVVPDVIGVPDFQQQAPEPSARPRPREEARPCWFTVKGSGRHIMLPLNGELVLGRFDAAFGIPPDIDLAYEDGEQHTVSRRHARVVGKSGYHTIEDTGSRYGLFVNGQQIKPGTACSLKPGDQVAIGGIKMFYDQIPEYLYDIPKTAPARHILIVTATGRKLEISPPNDITIGRSDPYVDFVPDFDLSQEGEAAARVSRRHAIIHWHDGKPYVEDLGSGFGTRVNGRMILIGQAVPLKPGDHIWLGGCVLAYDVEM